MITIVHVVPNESWQLAIKFSNGEYRLLNLSALREKYGWKELAYPQHAKSYTFSETDIAWEFGATLDSQYLYENSASMSGPDLERHSIRICYKNQAPTAEDQNHHLFGVYLYPFTERLFVVGESIGGGHGDRGGSRSFSLSELLAWQDWKKHFELSGCSWAIDVIEANDDLEHIKNVLINEARRRNGI